MMIWSVRRSNLAEGGLCAYWDTRRTHHPTPWVLGRTYRRRGDWNQQACQRLALAGFVLVQLREIRELVPW